MATEIQTVTGPTTPDELGRTLMHEHVLIGFPGWEADTIRPGSTRDEMRAICLDRIDDMRGHGVATMIDPCPNTEGSPGLYAYSHGTKSNKDGPPIYFDNYRVYDND